MQAHICVAVVFVALGEKYICVSENTATCVVIRNLGQTIMET